MQVYNAFSPVLCSHSNSFKVHHSNQDVYLSAFAASFDEERNIFTMMITFAVVLARALLLLVLIQMQTNLPTRIKFL